MGVFERLRRGRQRSSIHAERPLSADEHTMYDALFTGLQEQSQFARQYEEPYFVGVKTSSWDGRLIYRPVVMTSLQGQVRVQGRATERSPSTMSRLTCTERQRR